MLTSHNGTVDIAKEARKGSRKGLLISGALYYSIFFLFYSVFFLRTLTIITILTKLTLLTMLPLITSTEYITPTLFTILSYNYLTVQTI